MRSFWHTWTVSHHSQNLPDDDGVDGDLHSYCYRNLKVSCPGIIHYFASFLNVSDGALTISFLAFASLSCELQPGS